MQKVSHVGEQLRRKSREKEVALQTEFKESLKRLEKSLTELSSNKLTQIESDMGEKIDRIEKFGIEKIERLVSANHKLYKETIEAEKEEWAEELQEWRRLLLILLSTALIFGLILGVFGTLYLSQPKALIVSESEIAEGDGEKYLNIKKIPNLQIIKEEK